MQEIGKITDNGGRTIDRYGIEFVCPDGSRYWIVSGADGNIPDGVFMSLDWQPEGEEITFEELPERVQRDVQREAAIDWSAV